MKRKITESEKKLLSTTLVSEFEEILNRILLTDRQKHIFRLYYGKGYTISRISLENFNLEDSENFDNAIYYSEKTISKEITTIALKLADYHKIVRQMPVDINLSL